MKREFTVDDGLETYTFKNKKGEVFAEFSFNPADSGLLSRYESVVDFFNNMADSIDVTTDIKDIIVELEEKVKSQLNILLSRNVSEELFKTYAPFCVFANGDFYIEYILETLGTIIQEEMGVRVEKKLKKISKYTKQYQ